VKDRRTWRDLAEKAKTHKGLYCQMMMKYECMWEVALLCVNLVWIYKLWKHQLYTHCVNCLHCIIKYSKQETLLVEVFVVNIVQ